MKQLTAQEALLLSQNANPQQKADEDNIFWISHKIQSASKRGEMQTIYHDPISTAVIEKLRELGYKVNPSELGNLISWSAEK